MRATDTTRRRYLLGSSSRLWERLGERSKVPGFHSLLGAVVEETNKGNGVNRELPEEIQRWTAKRRALLVLSILEAETTVVEASFTNPECTSTPQGDDRRLPDEARSVILALLPFGREPVCPAPSRAIRGIASVCTKGRATNQERDEEEHFCPQGQARGTENTD
jgi:hypothetical protein